jgi:hypothetical protein
MVNQELVEYINLVHIIFFVNINVLYAYVAIRVSKGKIDGASKVILLMFYLVFLVEFILALI